MRYYERAGLMALPARTSSGYRDYDDAAAGQLLFITRARRMGLSCEQITSLLPVWAGTNCGAAHERVEQLITEKQAEIAERIADLQQFAAQLAAVGAVLAAEPPPQACRGVSSMATGTPPDCGTQQVRSARHACGGGSAASTAPTAAS